MAFYVSSARPAKKSKRKPARIPPQTPPPRGRNPKFPPNLKNSSLGFANPFPRKLFRKTESAFVFAHSPSFSFGKALCFAQRRFSARMCDELFVLKNCSSLVQ
jgi:hypothetical protein